MFGLFKSRAAPDGPLTIDFDIAIDRPAGEVFALIDFADPRNAKKQVGTVEPTGDNAFRMELDLVPGLVFDLVVTETASPRVYAFETTITPPVGRLVYSHERYEIEAAGDASCVLRLVTTVTFTKGMTMRQYENEVAMMTSAVHNALAKLKVHAEQGIEAIRQIERAQAA